MYLLKSDPSQNIFSLYVVGKQKFQNDWMNIVNISRWAFLWRLKSEGVGNT